jgi:hypothetical protein
MVDMNTQEEDVPPRLMEMLQIFLTTKSRGEQAVLILETRQGTLTTKYRTVEALAGVPATTNSCSEPPCKKNENPARTRRSRLRLEKFMEKKVNEKLKAVETKLASEAAGGPAIPLHDAYKVDTIDTKLLLELANENADKSNKTSLTSQIPQLDGVSEEKKATFSFVSEYGEEDILHALSETFPQTVVSNTTLVSRVRPSLRSAEHHCSVELMLDSEQNEDSFTWPEMKPWLKDTFQDIRRIQM